MEEFKETEQNAIELTAGEMLKIARTTGRRKREISTIAKQLCIREEFLQALEDGNYTLIPELVYILGFARNYAMELGLNPDEIVDKIKREMGVAKNWQAAVDGEIEASSAGAVCKNTKTDKAKIDFKAIFNKSWIFAKRNWYWFLGGLCVLLVGIGLLVWLMPAKQTAPEVVETPIVAEVVKSEPAYRVAVRERWGAENSKDAEIVLQAVRGSWIKIEDARGKIEFSRVLVEGDIYYLPVKGKFKATFGDAGGIDVWVKGELAPKVGEDHARKADILLTPEKLMATKSDKK